LVDFIKGAVTSVNSDEKMGTVFFSTLIVNIAEVLVIRSGRVPITFMV
jgi:hypothetical protein